MCLTRSDTVVLVEALDVYCSDEFDVCCRWCSLCVCELWFALCIV